jgi:epoxyqueuosine reductase
MRYLHRQARKRKDPHLAVPAARTAVVVLDNYYHPSPPADSPRPAPGIARYARGEDYHRVTLDRLEKLATFLVRRGAEVARPYVDTGPVAERELAQRAGLGWIGKNTMLIRPGQGSWFFIGSVFTDVLLDCDTPLTTDHCGSCTRCLEACPTGALVEPHRLDATRCISYLTIEYKGPVPEDLAGRMSGWAFGCDICNEVCPWNERFANTTAVPGFVPRNDLAGAGPDYFEDLSEEEFARRFGDTALARPGLTGMRRNWRAAWRSLP